LNGNLQNQDLSQKRLSAVYALRFMLILPDYSACNYCLNSVILTAKNVLIDGEKAQIMVAQVVEYQLMLRAWEQIL
jgi:hypothetical protein